MSTVVNVLLDRLKGTELARQISDQAKRGDAIAMRVANMYALLKKRREVRSEQMLVAAFKEWERRNEPA